MSTENPYQPPNADLEKAPEGEFDQSSPFSPKGRFGRLSYAAWSLLSGVPIGIVIVALALAGMVDEETMLGTTLPAIVAEVIGGLISAVLVYIFAARRFHDMNWSSWWALGFLVPLMNVVMTFIVILKPGTPGPNRFGPPRRLSTAEQVIGIIVLVLFVLGIVIDLAFVAFYLYLITQY